MQCCEIKYLQFCEILAESHESQSFPPERTTAAKRLVDDKDRRWRAEASASEVPLDFSPDTLQGGEETRLVMISSRPR